MHTQEIPNLPMKIKKAPKKSKKGKGKDKGKGRASTFKNMAGTLHRFGLEVSLHNYAAGNSMEPVTSQPEIDENGVVSGILEPRHLKPLRGMPFFASITTDTFHYECCRR